MANQFPVKDCQLGVTRCFSDIIRIFDINQILRFNVNYNICMILVNVNPRNGTLVIPKKIRQQLGIGNKVKIEIALNKLTIEPAEADLKSLFNHINKNKLPKLSDEEIAESLEEYKRNIKI